MSGINWGRVILGGLLAGLVFNLGEFVGSLFYMEDMKAALAAHDLTMSESAGMMAFYILFGFLWGILAVWLYAAIRPRFGPGPKTAILAGFVLWLTYLGAILGWSGLGLFPSSMLVLWAVVGLVELLIGTYLGGLVYKEG